jgi:dTDP-4-dehydrorhamnose reductase
LTKLDTANVTGADQLIGQLCTDWIFYLAGLSWVDRGEREADRCFNENARLPAVVAACTAQHGAGFVYYSTEYVFDGVNGAYDDAASLCPIKVRGRSKLAAEQQLLNVNPATLLVRTTVV